MKRKGNKKNYMEVDNFERKQKKHLGKRDKSSKRKLTIYDEFDDAELDDYSSVYDEFEEDEDF
jgi:phage terminase large subunit-like protein